LGHNLRETRIQEWENCNFKPAAMTWGRAGRSRHLGGMTEALHEALEGPPAELKVGMETRLEHQKLKSNYLWGTLLKTIKVISLAPLFESPSQSPIPPPLNGGQSPPWISPYFEGDILSELI